jgi:hypothetical protein
MLESDFRIKIYGFLKFPKSSLAFPLHYHTESTRFPLTCAILRGIDVMLLWNPPHILFIVGSYLLRFFTLPTYSPTKTFSSSESLISISWIPLTLRQRLPHDLFVVETPSLLPLKHSSSFLLQWHIPNRSNSSQESEIKDLNLIGTTKLTDG